MDATLTNGQHEPMKDIQRLWYQMFLSNLISSVLIHTVGAFILYIRLRSHHYAKWLAIIVQLAGFATPILLGSITNALLASILVFSHRADVPFYILIAIGLAQTLYVVSIGFLRIIQTL
jgi:biotin transporter BioY